MEDLLRIRSGEFDLSSAIKLSEAERLVREGGIEEKIIPVDRVFSSLQGVKAGAEAGKLLINGNRLPKDFISGDSKGLKNGENVRLYDDAGTFIGIYEYRSGAGDFKPVKLFL